MDTPLLTPMLVQYLVGLCCLRWDPDAIDVTLGDMILDPAAGKARDVDVTVTIAEAPGITRAFKAYEVKRENTALDVAEVEQLCLKLLDMSTITHRAVVSASGFTEAAQTKAAHHGVELYAMKPWSRPLEEQFPALSMEGLAQECFPASQTLLFWLQPQFNLVAPEAPEPFTVQLEDALFTADATPHPRFATFAAYRDELQLRSTEILFSLEPAATVLRTFPTVPRDAGGGTAFGPAWPHTHTLDVRDDSVCFKASGKLVRLEAVTINGHLQWQKPEDKPVYYVLERIPDGMAFAGAIVAMGARAGDMLGVIFSPKSRDIGVHIVRLAERHRTAIRRLKLELPTLAAAAP